VSSWQDEPPYSAAEQKALEPAQARLSFLSVQAAKPQEPRQVLRQFHLRDTGLRRPFQLFPWLDCQLYWPAILPRML
jgi:hypothetical protein